MPHLSLRISASADDVLTPCEDGTRSANCDDHHFSNCSPDKPSAEQIFSIESPAPSFLSNDLSVIFKLISGIGFLQCHAFNNLHPLVMSGRFVYVFAWRALYSHIAFLFAHGFLTERKLNMLIAISPRRLNSLVFGWVIKKFGLIPFFSIHLFSPGCCLQLSSSA